MSAPLRLHLGCGMTRMAGWVNADLHAVPGVTDVTFDCQAVWPFADNAASDVYASHMLEHLPDPWAFFRQAWRCLRPLGTLCLRVPYGGHKAAWADWTHVRPWFAENFCALQPGYDVAVGNPQHHAWRWPYAVGRVDLRLEARLARLVRWYPVRRLLVGWLDLVPQAVEELFVQLTPLKDAAAVAHFQQTGTPNGVPTTYVAWAHHWAGRPLGPGEAPRLVQLAAGRARHG